MQLGHILKERHIIVVAVVVEIACLTDLAVGPVGIIPVQVHIQQIAPVSVAYLQAQNPFIPHVFVDFVLI
jgi:hypothetical protein